jgi:hypothetical protein
MLPLLYFFCCCLCSLLVFRTGDYCCGCVPLLTFCVTLSPCVLLVP